MLGSGGRVSGCGVLGLLPVLAAAATASAGGLTIPTFTNETAARLSAPPGTGSADMTEKAYGIGDLDNDGDPDIAVGRRLRLSFPASETGAAAAPNVLYVNINGVLTDMTAALAPSMMTSLATRDTLVADVNGDGWLDVMFAHGDAIAPQLLLNQGEDGGGNWLGLANAPAGSLPAFVMDAWSLAAGDLANDGDEYPDIFLGAGIGNDRILRNLGDAGSGWLGFSEASSRLGANSNTSESRSAAAADMNLDGDMDLVQGLTGPTGAVRMLKNNGSGQFDATPPQNLVTGSAYNFGLGELDGDGRLDIFGVRNGTDQIVQNTGVASFDGIALGAAILVPNSNGFGAAVRVADLNLDGTDDFLVADLDQEFPDDCSRRLKIFFNSGASPFLSDGYPTPQPWTPNGASDVAMIDIDEDGDLDMLIGHCSGHSVFTQDGAPTPECPADLNNSGDVNAADLALLLGNWNCSKDCIAELNGTPPVNAADLALLLGAWGDCEP